MTKQENTHIPGDRESWAEYRELCDRLRGEAERLNYHDLCNLYAIVERSRRESNNKARRLENGAGRTAATTSAIERHLNDANLKAALVYKLQRLINDDE